MASNLNKVSVLRKEDSYGVINDYSGGFILRRNSININRNIEQRSSNLITNDLQNTAIYSGLESVSISTDSELSNGSYSKLLSAYLGRVFTKSADYLSNDVSISENAGQYNITGWLSTFGITIGSVVMLSGVAVNQNNKTNLVVTAVYPTSITVKVLNRNSLVIQTNITAGLKVIGTKSYIPSTDLILESFTLENQTDNLQQLFSGLVPNSISFTPNNSFCNLSIGFDAKKQKETGLTNKITISSKDVANPVCTMYAMLLINNSEVYVSDFSINSSRVVTQAKSLNSTSADGYSVGDYVTTFDFSAALKDWQWDNLLNTEVSITIVIPVDSSNASDFVRITIPSAKVTQVQTDDGNILMTKVSTEAVLRDIPNQDYSTFIIQESSTDVHSWNDLDVWNDSEIWYD